MSINQPYAITLILPAVLSLVAACASPGDTKSSKLLEQADAALSARKFDQARRDYMDAYNDARGPSRDDVRYAARIGLTRIDAAQTGSRAQALGKDDRDPSAVIGDILKARRDLRRNGSDESLELLLIQAQNAQTRRGLAAVKEQFDRGQTFAGLKSLEQLAVLPGLSADNQRDITEIRAMLADRHRKAAAQATISSLPFTARFHEGLVAAAEKRAIADSTAPLIVRVKPRIEAVSIRGGGPECESMRKGIESRVRNSPGDQPVTLEIDNFACVRSVQDRGFTERVRYTVKEPYTFMKSYDDKVCTEVPRSTSLHTYCSGVYHKPGTSGMYNPNCDVRQVTVPAHSKCETVKRQREETAFKEVERSEPRNRTERRVTWTATGNVSIRTGGTTTTHPIRQEWSEKGDSYAAVGTLPKADFPWQLADSGPANQAMRERLSANVWSELERLVRLRLEPDFSDVTVRIADAQAKGKAQEADEMAIRAAAFGKGSGNYLDQRFGVPNSYVPVLFSTNPSLNERTPVLPAYVQIKRGEMIPVFND